MTATRTLILDRDGVINHDSADFIKSAKEWIPIPGSIEAIALASQAGWRVVVATNQSGVGRGLFDEFALAHMHEKLARLVEDAGGSVAGVFYCPHAPDAGCDCRKPKAGLLSAIAETFECDLSGSPLVGDSLRDLEAAVSAGCTPILVRTGKGANTEAALQATGGCLEGVRVAVFDDLAAVVAAISDA